MVVIVKQDCFTDRYIQLPDDLADDPRRIAFRFVHKRKETDFNELVHNTRLIQIEKVEKNLVDFVQGL